MFEKLEQVAQRYNELTDKLSDPAVIARRQEFQTLAKERAQLAEVVETYQIYRKLQGDLEGAQQLLEDSDRDIRAMARDDVERLEAEQEALTAKLEVLLLPRDPNDDKNVILEIRSGTGGDEAALFAGDLFRMYLHYAETHRWKTEVMTESLGAQGGYKEIIVAISGDQVYSQLKYESGVHRVQRVPDTETQGRIHTSAATVAVLPEADEVEVRLEDKDLRIDVFRAGGPGGQCVNTTDSAVRITHIPTGTVVICQDEKSQHKNKAKALKVLRARIYETMLGEQQDAIAEERRAMVKSGDRSDKIRTYNFPQDRVTDHRIGLTMHNLPKIMQGDIEELVTSLRTHFQAEALKHNSAD
ncbi:MAG: peptide chain release factor 1 [Pseudomonadota bacterium]